VKLSIIIPTLNEAEVLSETFDRLKKEGDTEIIVVDGGSRDQSVEIARKYSDKVYIVPPGRAGQMNFGARQADGDILLFLHADSVPDEGGIQKAIASFSDPTVVGGAFQLQFNTQRFALRLIARFANIRTRMTRVPYGDQGLFILKRTFESLGGFPEVPIMEDVLMAIKMKQSGKIRLLREKIVTSARRWEKEGLFRTTIQNRLLMIGFGLGVSPVKLAEFRRSRHEMKR